MAGNFGPAPRGLQQAAEQQADRQQGRSNFGPQPSAEGGGATARNPWAPRNWYSGANMQGQENGYDTPFFQKFFSQQEEAYKNGRLGDYFDQERATGVVTFDHASRRNPGIKYEFGDVYEDGKKIGNIYKTYDEKTADLMMADLTLDAKTKKEAFRAPDGPDRIAREVQARRQDKQVEHGKWASQQEYQGEVKEQVEDFEKSGNAETLTAAGGAAGGATVGFGIGAAIGSIVPGVGTGIVGGIGAAIGAITGGIGAWLNRDELIDQAARAQVQQEIATREFGTGAGFAAGLQGWSGLGMKALSPASNLLHGVYDEAQGVAGDSVSEWHKVTDEGKLQRTGAMTALDVGAGLTDAIGQFASGAGVLAFTGAMTGTIGGEIGLLATSGGYQFDDRSGKFDNIFYDDEGNKDWGSAAAGIGKIGIDAVQLGMARGLTRAATSSMSHVGVTTGTAYAGDAAKGLVGRLQRAVRFANARTTVEGFSYKLDDAGRAIQGSRRASLSLLAPSEALGALSASMLARRAAARDGGAASADDFYRAAAKMATGDRRWTAALVNGFGEGGEEAVQAILEPLSHGSAATGQEIWNAALQGFGMGMGMTIGAGSRGATADMRQYAQAFVVQNAMGMGDLTKSTWDKMTDVEKRKAAAAPPELAEAAKAAAKDFARSQKTSAIGNAAAVEKYVDAVRKLALREQGKLTDRTDAPFVITQLQDAGAVDDDGNVLPGFAPSHAVGSSLLQLRANMARRLEGLTIQLAEIEDADPIKPELVQTDIEMQDMLGFLEQGIRMWDADTDPAVRRRVIDSVNQRIGEWFAAQDNSEGDVVRMARARATSQLFGRDPHDQSGSYPMLMPFAVFELSQENANNVLQVSHAVLQAMGGDYDGDKVRELAQLMVDAQSFANVRAGMGYLGAMGATGTSVNIMTREYETYEVALLSKAIREGGKAYADEAIGTLKRIRGALERRYDGIIDTGELKRTLDRFVREMRAGDTAARAHLIDSIAEDFGGEITAYARENLSNEWLWIDQVVQANLQRFQRVAAAHAPRLGKPNTTALAPTSQTTDYREVRARNAATDGITLSLRAAGETLFRMFQKLHYSSWNAAVTGVKEGNVEELVELTAVYEEMGQQMTQTELDALGAQDDIIANVQATIRAAASDARRLALETGDQLDEMASVAILANAAVPYVYTSATGEVRVRQNVTWAQGLLAREVEKARVDRSASMTPELSSKLARYEQLTQENSGDRAFVEVFAQTQLYELLGEAAVAMGSNLTVGQFVQRYMNQSESQKQDTGRLLKQEPEYLGRERKQNIPYSLAEVQDKQVTGYRSVVDSVLGAGNKRLSVDAAGHAIGDYGKRSDSYHEALVSGFRQLQVALDEAGLYRKGFSRKKPEAAQAALAEFMNNNKDWAAGVMMLIPDAAANAVFEVVTVDGVADLKIAPWVYEMMLMRDPEEAVMHYWRNSKVASWNALGSLTHLDETDDAARAFDSLDSRIHRLMYRLATAGDLGISLQRFTVAMNEAKSLPEFLAFVNKELRADEAPYVAWIDDWAEFSPDRSGGGLTSILPGAEMREAILEFRDRSDRLVATIHDEHLVEIADAATMIDVGRALALGDKATDAERITLAGLERAIEFARNNLTVLGPGAMRQQSLGALIGFFAQAHTKGISPWNVVPIGRFDALGDSFGYATPYDQHEAAIVGTQDPEDIGSHMGLAARDAQLTMLPDGTPVDWPQLNAAEIYKQWNTNPDARPAIRAMLFPSAWERTQDGRLVQQFLTGKSITELINGETYSSFFEESHQSRMLYGSLLESRAKAHGASHAVQRLVNDILQARASSLRQALTPAEGERMVDQAYSEVADLMRIVGELGARSSLPRAQLLEALKKEVRERARLQQAAATIGFKGEDALVLTRLVFDQLLEDKRGEVIAAMAEADAAGNHELALALRADFETTKKRAELILSDDPFRLVADAYSIPFGADPAEVKAKQLEVVEYVRTHPNLLIKAGWAKTDLRHITTWLAGNPAPGELPIMSDASWSMVSRAIVGTYLDDMVSITADGVSVPVFPKWDQERQLRYWDPSYGYLLDDMLDPEGPLVKAAAELQVEAGRNAVRNSLPELIDKFFATIYAPFSLGPWTSDVARMSITANSRLDPAAAGDAIAMAGLAPVRQATESVATAWTFEIPPDEAFATASLSLEQVRRQVQEGQEYDIPVTLNGIDSTLPMMALNGRFVRSAAITYTDATGAQQQIDLFSGVPKLGRDYSQEPVPSGLRSITARGLHKTVDRRLPTSAKDVQVVLEFVHPDAQPGDLSVNPADPDGPQIAAFANNVYFGGLPFELDAAQQRSSNAALWAAPGSISPQEQAKALGSNKSGKPALEVTPVVDSAERAVLEAGWQQDFAAMIHRKTVQMITKDTGSGALQNAFYNVVRDRMKRRHFVRGFLTTGDPVLWTAEEVITWQQRNPGVPLETVLTGAELWKPSPRVLRSMLGETGAQGVVRADNGLPELDVSQIPVYHGTAGEILARMPGILRVDESGAFITGGVREFLATQSAQRSTQSRLRVGPMISSARRTAYEAGLRSADARKQKIYAARSKVYGGTDSTLRTWSENGKQAAQGAFEATTSGLNGRAANLPFIGAKNITDAVISGAIFAELNAAIEMTPLRALWVYLEGTEGNGVATSGILNEVSLKNDGSDSATTHLQLAPEDGVVVSLEQLENVHGAGTKEVHAAARKRVKMMMDARATIVLPDGRTGGDLRYELGQYMREAGYRQVEGSKHIFRPMKLDSIYATQQARLSTQTETHTISADSAVTVLLVEDKAIAENAAVIVNPGGRNPVAVTADLVPVNAFGRFNVPIGREQVGRVQQQVRALAGAARGSAERNLMYSLLQVKENSTEAKDFDAALKRLIENWDDDPENPRVTPRRGTQFGTGDLIPLFDAKSGALLFYRHGHQAPRPADVEQDLRAAYREGERGANLAFYRGKVNPAHTTHRGDVISFNPRSQYGLSVQMRVPLQELGDKLQLEGNGMKYVLTTMSKDMLVLPGHGIFDGWPIDLVAAWSDTQSKESYLGLVDNFRNAFAHFGVDFMPELAKTLYGVDLNTVSEDEANTVRGQVDTVLRVFQRVLPRQEVPVIHDILRSQAPEALLSELLAPLGTLAGADLAPDWQSAISAVDAAPEAEITRAILLYLMTPQAEVEHVLRSGGFNAPGARTSNGLSVMMPQLFTNTFDRAPIGSSLRRHLMDKLNAQLYNPNTDGTGYYLAEDFSFHVENADRHDNMTGWLQFSEAHSSGDNPVLNEMALARNSEDQKISQHTIDVAFQAIGARTVIPKGKSGVALERTERFISQKGIEKFDRDASLWELLRNVPAPNVDTINAAWRELNPAQVYRKQLAREAVAQTRQPLDRTGGEDGEAWTAEQEAKFLQLRNEVALAFGLSEKQSGTVDFWIRQMLGQPLGEGDSGRVSYISAMETMEKELLWNAKRHYLPTHGAEIPQIHYNDLNLLYRAFEKRNDGGTSSGFWLTNGTKKNDPVLDWDDWVNVALAIGETEHQLFDPMFLLATDGMVHSYSDAEDRLVGLPISRSSLVDAKLLDPETMSLVMSLDPNQEAILQETPLMDPERASLADIMGGQRMAGGTFRGQHVPASVRARRQAARLRWRREGKIPRALPFSVGHFKEAGAMLVQDGTSQHALLRILTNLRVGNALFNPFLWVSAIGETMIRGSLEDATNVITGDSTGQVARALPFAGRYTPEQLTKFRRLQRTMGQRADFKGMVYKELMFKHPIGSMSDANRAERWSHNFARLGSMMQDPTYGMRGDVLARRYLEAVLLYMNTGGSDMIMSPDYLVAQLSSNPMWVQSHEPRAHAAAMATIANVRSLKPTVASLMMRGVYEPLSNNPNMIFALPSTLFLKLPLLFSGYAMNVATSILGLQGANAMTAMFLEGREKGPGSFIGRMQAFMGGREFNEDTDARFDMSEVLEGIDLSKAFIQGGLTHTALFALGMTAGGLGLTGEDDEDRRRRRAAKMQGGDFVYDPREIENDFRNADALYLDWLPFGLGSMLTGAGEDQPQILDLHWIMKQFVSPIVGMAKFFETGDRRHIVWGFQDALNSFPLINSASWDDAVTTFTELQKTAAEHEELGTEDALLTSFDFALKGMWTMERMLFENSFVNMLYVGSDKYDRDPWALPERDAEGNIMRDRMDIPRPTKAMEDHVDPVTGEVVTGYVNRDWWDAQLHGFAENRATLALMSSLFTGFNDSTMLRSNMVAKIRKIDKPEMSIDEAQGLILSIWDEETGYEMLTKDGARALFRGIWKGSVPPNLDSPALQGLFIPFEMRGQIQKEWMAELIQEGVDMGLTEAKAKSRMYELWKGPSTDPTAKGLGDILWDDRISYAKNLRYNQLNTTYIIGPDGYPWATGIQRDKLMNAFGLLGQRYYQGDVGNMGVDGRLNSTDVSVGLNTGLRGLEKSDESWLVPTPEEIGEGIEKAIKEAMQQSYEPSKWQDFGKSGWRNFGRGSGWRNFGRGGGYRRGGYGGGGGGGYGTKLNPPQDNQTPYSNSIPFINTSNPIIRRATIKRERFDSDKGRLNQWQ